MRIKLNIKTLMYYKHRFSVYKPNVRVSKTTILDKTL